MALKHLLPFSLIFALIATPALAQTPTITGVSNTASFTTTFSTGSLATIFGTNLTTVGGTPTVTWGGLPCYVFMATATQINVQLPVGSPLGPSNLVVHNGSSKSAPFSLTLKVASPGIFTANGSGTGLGTFTDGGLTLSATTNAKIADVVSGYGVGLGATVPLVATGIATPGTLPLPTTIVPPTATVNGTIANVSFAGLSPGLIGTYQVNFTIPPGVAPGNRNVRWSIDGFTSPPVTIPIGGTPAVTTLASSLNPLTYGQSVTLTATVSPSTATGLVTFYNGATVLGVATVSSAQAQISTISLPSGSLSITAFYNGDENNAAGLSLPFTQTVTPVAGGSFSGPVTYGAGKDPYYVAVGDFNADGKADLAVADTGTTLNILLGNGDGTFKTAVPYTTGYDPQSVIVGDLNNDGYLDVVTANYYGSDVSVLMGKGDGTFNAAVNYSSGVYPWTMAAVDLNGDGNLDLAAASATGNVNVLLGNGDGTFQPPVAVPTGTLLLGLAAGDFNGDGIPDLAATDNSSGQVDVLLGIGDGTFQPPLVNNVGQSPEEIVVSDFNGDGKADLAVALGPYNVIVLLGNGDGTFQLGVAYGSFAGSQGLAVADFNADGIPDLVATGSGNVYVLLGNGDGTFQPSAPYTAGTGSLGVAAADFNGDGIADLVTANNGSTNVSIFLGVAPSKSQAISFGPLSNVAFGVAPFPIPATASSGLNLAFFTESTGICSVSGTTVTILGSGICSITAVQPGNATYGAAPPMTESFTVNAATQTISFGVLTDQTVGATPPPLSANSSSGLGVTFAVNAGATTVCTLSGVNITLVAAGTCSITASQNGNSNYLAATPVTQTFTVSAAAIQPVAAFLDQNGAPALTFNGSTNFPDAGGFLISAPGVTQDLNGNVYVVGLDGAGGVHLNSYSSTNSTWNGWQYSGGILDTSSGLTAAVDPSGVLWFTGRDIGNRYWINSWNGNTFGGWILVADGIFSGDSIPQIAIPSDGTIYVIGKDIGGRIWSNSYNPANQTFTGWVDRQAVMIGQPSVTAGQDGMVYVAVRSVSSESPVYITQIPAQNAATANTWLNGGGLIDTDPQITSQGGTIYLLAEADGNTVYLLTFLEATQSYGTWTFTNGVLSSATIAAAAGNVFVAGPDGSDRIYWYSLTGNSWFFAGGAGISSTVLAGGK
jgi:uncharacterized protein (TIGR03437 family)